MVKTLQSPSQCFLKPAKEGVTDELQGSIVTGAKFLLFGTGDQFKRERQAPCSTKHGPAASYRSLKSSQNTRWESAHKAAAQNDLYMGRH
ncbi:hypothetical protein Bca52824_016670 [Brassica carinata]|uniref:Uncharacterized protein n=1 Tax=Brassica carinata TaxID=52824 RepID=A0A8X8B6W4_BRACI|nr:hypothetical protein Bca52824_016670 [Brassica carinata]